MEGGKATDFEPLLALKSLKHLDCIWTLPLVYCK